MDNTETLTDSYTYTPYGKLSNHDGTSENGFLFTGEQLDSETDNYYLRARYYSPSQGRFTSIDPFEGRMFEPNTLNDYIYAGGNPVMYVDLSGEFFSMAELSMTMNMMSYMRTGLATSFAMRTGSFYGMRAILNLHNFIYGGSVIGLGVKNGVRWGFWRDLPKFVYRGTKYALVRGRLYTEHAVNRMTPTSYGMAAGRYDGPRGIPTMVVEYAIMLGRTLSREIVNGGIRYTKQYGEIFVVFERTTGGKEVIISVRKATGL